MQAKLYWNHRRHTVDSFMIKHISNCKLNKMEVNFITLFPTKVVVKAAMPNSILIQKYSGDQKGVHHRGTRGQLD